MPSVRQSNFELLRILCALFIISGHIINLHGPGDFGSFSWYISVALRPWFVCAVNTFILLSGYFGIKLHAKKMWLLNDMVTFYSVLIFVVALMFEVGRADRFGDIHSFILFAFPVLCKQYWFITIYFALCLLSPALNFFADNASRTLFRNSLITAICLFVLLPTVAFGLNFQNITEDAGYGIVNFCTLYLLGRFIHKYDSFKKYSRNVGFMVYIGASICCGLFQVLYSCLLGFSFTSYISYNTLFVFLSSIGLFLSFHKLSIKQNTLINKLSTYCLCSYVIHAHPMTFKYIFVDIFGIATMSDGAYLASIFILPVIVYSCCAIIETIRFSIIQRIIERKVSKVPYFSDSKK